MCIVWLFRKHTKYDAHKFVNNNKNNKKKESVCIRI